MLIPPPDPGTGDLYAMDDSQLVSDKSPLEEPPDVPSLRCSASPPLHAAGPFSLLEASRPAPPLLASPSSPPALHGTWTAPRAPPAATATGGARPPSRRAVPLCAGPWVCGDPAAPGAEPEEPQLGACWGELGRGTRSPVLVLAGWGLSAAMGGAGREQSSR